MMGKNTQTFANPALDEQYMRRALLLAEQGLFTTEPNPMVGAVIVHQGRIIGEGYHIRAGDPHAEIQALQQVKSDDLPLLKQSCMYVSLEPCSHQGRTPPCAERIIREQIPRVVVGCIDPFARVKGNGVEMLRRAGIEVVIGVLEKECLRLNRRFVTFHQKQRPFITLKWARSADGYIDRIREIGSPQAEDAPVHLSTMATQQHVHRLRSMHKSILVGHKTWVLDRPRLDIRHWYGASPQRCVLGTCTETMPSDVWTFPTIDLLLAHLHGQGIQSLLVEGGRQTLQAFIDRGLWDEVFEECASVTLGQGVPAPVMPRLPDRVENIWNVSFNRWFATD